MRVWRKPPLESCSVTTVTSAPIARMKRMLFSLAFGSVITVRWKPLAAHTDASAIPRFPEVDSISRDPRLRTPSASASSTIARAALSLIEPAGLSPSSFRWVVNSPANSGSSRKACGAPSS